MDVNGVQIIDIDEPVTIGMDTPIEIGEHLPTGTVSITENGTHNVGGYKYADVDVELDPPPLQNKVAMATKNEKFIEADDDYYGLSAVYIPRLNLQHIESVYPSTSRKYIEPTYPEDVASLVMDAQVALPYTTNIDLSSLENGNGYVFAVTTRPANLEELEVTANGTYTAPEDGGYTPVIVNVQPNLQSKTATPTESIQTITPDSSYYGLSSVEVGAISSGYVGSGVTRRSSSDLTASGPTIAVPAGYYENNATKSVNTATLPTEAISSPEYGYNFKSIITPSDNSQFIDIPAGYNPENVFYEFGKMWRGSKTITENGTYLSDDDGLDGYSSVTVSVPGQIVNNQNKSVNPTESTQTVTADSGYTGLGTVSVSAISNTYVGSGITRRSSSDLSASGATVTTPAGYYASQATKSVASGTAGTPTASKGTVSNHSVSVTPSVTNTTGYISGGTKTGTAVSVSASELVSGSETKTDNGTYDVTNLASLVVDISFVTYYTGSGAPSSSLGSNGDIYLRTS